MRRASARHMDDCIFSIFGSFRGMPKMVYCLLNTILHCIPYITTAIITLDARSPLLLQCRKMFAEREDTIGYQINI